MCDEALYPQNPPIPEIPFCPSTTWFGCLTQFSFTNLNFRGKITKTLS